MNYHVSSTGFIVMAFSSHLSTHLPQPVHFLVLSTGRHFLPSVMAFSLHPTKQATQPVHFLRSKSGLFLCSSVCSANPHPSLKNLWVKVSLNPNLYYLLLLIINTHQKRLSLLEDQAILQMPAVTHNNRLFLQTNDALEYSPLPTGKIQEEIRYRNEYL